MINLSVEPLSQQSITALPQGLSIPLTATVFLYVSKSAPSSVSEEIVADISFENEISFISEIQLLNAAQISILWT